MSAENNPKRNSLEATRLVELQLRLKKAGGRSALPNAHGLRRRAIRLLDEIETIAGRAFVEYLFVVLEVYWMREAGFSQSRVGHEHPAEERRTAREKRYTLEGVRRDLRRIKASASNAQQLEVEREVKETSHTARLFLSRKLLCEPRQIEKRSLEEIAHAAISIPEEIGVPPFASMYTEFR